jgi:uncharacterized membrane protein YeiB
MTEIASYAVVAVILMAFVQWIKNWSVLWRVEPLLILAGVSVIAGAGYLVLKGYGLWEIVLQQMLILASAANAIYQVLDRLLKATSGNTLARTPETPPVPPA